MAVAAALVLAGGFVSGGKGSLPPWWREATRMGLSRRAAVGWTLTFAVFFLLSVDWWGFRDAPRLTLGLPGWVFYFAALCILLSVAFFALGRSIAAPLSAPTARRRDSQ